MLVGLPSSPRFRLAPLTSTSATRAVLLLAVALAAGCGGKGGEEKKASKAKPFPPKPATMAKVEAPRRAGAEASMRKVHVRQMVGGRMEVELWATEAWHSQGADWVRGRNVKAWYFPEHRKPTVLHATEAVYNVLEQRLLATGEVRVESEGSVLETTQLTYDARRDRIYTKRPVRVVRGDNVMTGVGLEADPDLGNLKIGEPHISANRPGEIRPLLGDRETKPPKGR